MKILAIERLRAVAIITVYLIHVPIYGGAFGYFRPLAFFGTWAGVDLFFVISGFVVTLSLERLLPERASISVSEPISKSDAAAIRSFYIRRFFRLAPIAGCALLLHFAGAALGPRIAPSTPFLTLRDWLVDALAILSGLYNFIAPYLDHPAMTFFWSLSVEEQFYLLLPGLFLLAATRRARRWSALAVIFAVAVVIRPLFSPKAFEIAHFSSQYRFDALAAGVALALSRERASAIVARVNPLVRKLFVVVGFGVLLYVSRHMPIWFALHYGLVAIWAASAWMIACAATDGRDVLDIPVVNRALEYVGSRSYAIYVLHTAFLMTMNTIVLAATPNIARVLSSRVGQTLQFVVTVAVTLAAAELAHRYIEMPCIAYGKRVVATRASAGLPEPAS